MAITTGSLVEMEVHFTYYNQQYMNVFQYQVNNMPPSVTAGNLAQGYWNHIKATYRALAATSFGSTFQKIVLRELNNPVGELAEFGIPEGEQVGTRTPPGGTDAMPPFNSAGVRLLVGTRATRPGQKRVGWIMEADNTNASLQPAMTALITNWANVMFVSMALGSPAALASLIPIITRKTPQGLVLAHQPIISYLINPLVTTQNSRKIGRGM